MGIVDFVVNLVGELGYFGIFAMMFLESSFVPFPSEVALIPAGFLVFEGKMKVEFAFLAGVGGSLIGAFFNYYLCYFFGRKIITKYGKYLLITPEKFAKFEEFFIKHGEISTFSARLIFGIRQYISLPAGLAKMNIFKFGIFTALGSSIWVATLLAIGYFLGQNPPKKYITWISIAFFIFVICLILIYKKVKK